MKENIEALLEALQQMVTIREAGEANGKWEILYDIGFSHHNVVVEPLLRELGIRFKYFDPNTTYEEDLRALIDALEQDVLPVVRDLHTRFNLHTLGEDNVPTN